MGVTDTLNQALPSLPDRFKKPMQVVNARATGADFTLLDRKIFNILLALAYRELPTGRVIHRVQMRQLADALAMGGQEAPMERIHDSLKRLFHAEIEIKVREDERESLIRCHYLSTQHSTQGEGWLDYAFDQILLRYLRNPKVYSVIQLPVATRFRSLQALHLYEVMQGKYGLFVDKTFSLTIEEAYDFFDVPVGSVLRSRNDQFKSRKVERAVEEVNEIAEFDVAADYVRHGRGGKIVGVDFTVAPKPEGRIAAAAEVVRAGRVRLRDQRTPDLFSGLSDAERSAPTLRPDTLLAARDLVGPEGDLEDHLERWREEFRPRGYGRNPDEMFLAWLRLTMDCRRDEDLQDVDVEAVFFGLVREDD